MLRHHFPKVQISNATEVLVSSDIIPYYDQNLTFFDRVPHFAIEVILLSKFMRCVTLNGGPRRISRRSKEQLSPTFMLTEYGYDFYFRSCAAAASNNTYSLHSATILAHTIACLHNFFSETKHCYSRNDVRSQLVPFSVVPWS